MDSNQIRTEFLNYFKKLGHRIIPSSSLVPEKDPTILFTSAGMVQFKDMFLGRGKMDFRRASSSQKCFRTSDIEKVGHTARHLTFFEMLGNFSFGDYFKKEAIQWCWDFLVNRMNLDKDKLYASVYIKDHEASDIWKGIVPEGRIVKLGKGDNFWEMGSVGPCGPCSEVLVDMGEEMGCKRSDCGPGCDCDRWLEVWNLVFTQFDKQPDGELKPLKQKNIDTGMGLERLSAIVNGYKSAFDTDLLKPLVDEALYLTKSDRRDEKSLVASRIIADHTRGICFLVAGGVLPSNEGRGYVLRRILRRATRQGKILGIDEPFLFRLTGEVVRIMKKAYPELEKRRDHIALVCKMEEEKFHQTLTSGINLLEEIISKLKKQKEKEIPGEEVFRLYDTYGFPLDLVKEIGKEQGFNTDEKGFENLMNGQRERARLSWKGSGEANMEFIKDLKEKLGVVNFRGYDFESLSTHVLAFFKVEEQGAPNSGEIVEEVSEGEEVFIILSETPFYGEAGGQIGDTGRFIKVREGEKGLEVLAEIEIIDTHLPLEDFTAHRGKVKKGNFKKGDTVEAIVDSKRRQNIRIHHTSTHLLQRVLRDVLGSHVEQSGSFVGPDRFRFDFTHPKALDKREIDSIESKVNEKIRNNLSVLTVETSLQEAKNMGAMALFGEKYGERVRAIMITREGIDAPQDAFSIELCAGTHARATGEIGLFKIVSETGIAAGMRRIEAVCGETAYNYIKEKEEALDRIADLMRVKAEDVFSRVEKLIRSNRDMEKELEKYKGRMAVGLADELIKKSEKVKDASLIIANINKPEINQKGMRELLDGIKGKKDQYVAVFMNKIDDKVFIVAGVSKDLVKKGVDAGKIVKEIAPIVGGSGGGKPEMAQAGGKNPEKIEEALKKAREIVKEQLRK